MIDGLNKLFESRIRIGVMAVLMANHNADFLQLKNVLQVTDGNLASHLAVLEKNNFVRVNKKFVGRKTNTTYEATAKGRKIFREHLDAMELLIKKI